LLSDLLRHDLGLTGTHVGCEHGVCGCCTPSDPPLDPPEGRVRPDGAEPRPGGVEDSEVTGRLPRRVRQGSLAPQLRGRSAPRHGRPAASAGEDDFEEPSPELSRDLMASLQSGWLRGRVDDDPGELDPRDEWGES
ncbi:hypothetical protein ABWI04_41230, partial [Actinomadura sp. NPDC000929]